MLYSTGDSLRPKETTAARQQYRSDFRRDYARIIHSPSFRRLQGKTQLFPGNESDFFRNRLTHSLEVAQIAKSIALKLNADNIKLADGSKLEINPDLTEIAGLAHDLGHPPFGHQGEEALDECMANFGGFEGNAQTLRILSCIEKKANLSHKERYGLNLTYRVLASVLKYDSMIPRLRSARPKKYRDHAMKGYYRENEGLVKEIKQNVLGKNYSGKFKTLECWIMDVADDIAYSTYDLEDSFKAGFLHPFDLLFAHEQVYSNVAKQINDRGELNTDISPEDVREVLLNIFLDNFNIDKNVEQEYGARIFKNERDLRSSFPYMIAYASGLVYNKLSLIAKDGRLRTAFTSNLINDAINAVKFEENKTFSPLSKVVLSPLSRLKVECLKLFVYESQILSAKLKLVEYRGKEIVSSIFKALQQDDGWRLLPPDYQQLYLETSSPGPKKRVLCDFIAGMTDRYAIEFLGRLRSSDASIYKPI